MRATPHGELAVAPLDKSRSRAGPPQDFASGDFAPRVAGYMSPLGTLSRHSRWVFKITVRIAGAVPRFLPDSNPFASVRGIWNLTSI